MWVLGLFLGCSQVGEGLLPTVWNLHSTSEAPPISNEVSPGEPY
jgi:hypothetical protein